MIVANDIGAPGRAAKGKLPEREDMALCYLWPRSCVCAPAVPPLCCVNAASVPCLWYVCAASVLCLCCVCAVPVRRLCCV